MIITDRYFPWNNVSAASHANRGLQDFNHDNSSTMNDSATLTVES